MLVRYLLKAIYANPGDYGIELPEGATMKYDPRFAIGSLNENGSVSMENVRYTLDIDELENLDPRESRVLKFESGGVLQITSPTPSISHRHASLEVLAS